MRNIIKRYFIAVVFLLAVVLLMLLSTLAVKSFGDGMLKNVNIEIKPRGEKIDI